jgi:hypothetical protein
MSIDYSLSGRNRNIEKLFHIEFIEFYQEYKQYVLDDALAAGVDPCFRMLTTKPEKELSEKELFDKIIVLDLLEKIFVDRQGIIPSINKENERKIKNKDFAINILIALYILLLSIYMIF